jgi:hypothetical protein
MPFEQIAVAQEATCRTASFGVKISILLALDTADLEI